MVESRWAMAITVLPSISVVSASWIAASTSESSAEVASSRTRIGASFRMHAGDGDALALAARELDAALADLRVVARAAPCGPRAPAMNSCGVGEPRGPLDLGLASASGRP